MYIRLLCKKKFTLSFRFLKFVLCVDVVSFVYDEDEIKHPRIKTIDKKVKIDSTNLIFWYTIPIYLLSNLRNNQMKNKLYPTLIYTIYADIKYLSVPALSPFADDDNKAHDSKQLFTLHNHLGYNESLLYFVHNN